MSAPWQPPPPDGDPRRFLRQVGIVTAAALLVLVAWRATPWIADAVFGPGAEPRQVTARGELAPWEQTTIEIFEAARDSVVYVETRAVVRAPWERQSFEVPQGTGSGFVWDRRGHIVTNAHVLQGASSARVLLADGRSFEASLVGASPEHDLAVLRIRVGVDRPRPIPVGEAGSLRVGQAVFAIGNPFGLDWTLTTGVVSALDRSLPSENGRPIRGLVQTDAAINPGNSGGPLIDSAGRLIGVNTAIYSPSGASAGIGFAVPVDTVNRVVPQIIGEGRYEPPRLGIEVNRRINEQLTRRLGFEGVAILAAPEGGPAAEAGLEGFSRRSDGSIVLGDIIVGLGGTEIANTDDLYAALERHEPGETVSLRVRRADGSEREVEITLAPPT